MLDILQAPGHVAAFRLSGDVTTQDYDRMFAELEARLKQHARIAVYAELSEPTHVRLSAIIRDFRFSLAKLGEWHRFARMALVTDKDWAAGLVRGVATWLPNIELRVFAGCERGAALAWTAELQPQVPPGAALRMIPTTRPDTYAFAWNGRISRDDVDRVLGVLKTELESHISVRLLARIEDMGGMELQALIKAAASRVKLLGMRKIERYAIVGGPGWLDRYVAIARAVTGLDMRHFPQDEERVAWTWLEAQPAAKEDSASGQAEAVSEANTRNTAARYD
jgi:hypothetical protein